MTNIQKNQRHLLLIGQIFDQYNRSFANLQQEIDKHNHQLKRFVSVIFTSITVTITFLVYLITMTEQNIIFICLYLVVLHSHYMILILLIIASDIIKDNNEKILRLKRKCLSLSTLDKKIFLNRQLFKVNTYCIFCPFIS